ncbi:hypothetical protein VTI74DRAFT_6108 [Chaetomium olivicolor]
MQRRPGRTPSGHLSRLRPVEHDPLAEYGLPSKGEKRLLSPKVQESYYSKIVERYLAFCTEAGDRDTLQKQFARLAIADTKKPSSSTAATLTSPLTTPGTSSSSTLLPVLHNNDALSQILSALRKLREALVASHRADDFAIQVYLFSVRLGVLASSYETYLPSLLHLLRRHTSPSRATHRTTATTSTTSSPSSKTTTAPAPNTSPPATLTTLEQSEAISYLILDAACRRGDLAHALHLRRVHSLADARVRTILSALVHDNWVLWRRVKAQVDGYQRRIMEFAEHRVRQHALKAWGRAYLNLPLGVVEREMGLRWAEVRERYGVGWEVDESAGDGGKVIIRKVGGR